MRLPVSSVNQRLPSPPVVIEVGPLPAVTGYSEMTPLGVIIPMFDAELSVNQRLPSGPTVMPSGSLPAVSPVVKSVITPLGPIALAVEEDSVNQRLPSGPSTIPHGAAFDPSGKLEITPAGEISPISFADFSVNQRFPFGPGVIIQGAEVLDTVVHGPPTEPTGLANAGAAKTPAVESPPTARVSASHAELR
jgi:hypothetical protein